MYHEFYDFVSNIDNIDTNQKQIMKETPKIQNKRSESTLKVLPPLQKV